MNYSSQDSPSFIVHPFLPPFVSFLRNSAILFVLIGGILNAFPGLAKTNFPLINSAYKYDPNAPVKCQYQLASHQDSLHLYLQIIVANGTLEEDFLIGYELKEFYGEKSLVTLDSLNTGDYILTSSENIYYLKIPLLLENLHNLFLLSVRERGEETYYFDIPIRGENNFNPPNLLLIEGNRDVPYFNSFANSKDPIRIIKPFEEINPDPLFCYVYKYDFTNALPPMASSDEVSQSMKIDSTFSFSEGETLRLGDEALYFIQADTSGLEGISFRIVDDYYPDFRRLQQLTQPLVYISTRSEYARVKDTDDKKDLDKYWLSLIKTPSRAKVVIKRYYDQIATANEVFTTYKEGWKTDQGMIYALYGAPDEVYFNGVEEQWIYKKNAEILRVKFTFVKIKNIFTRQHFELVRNRSYERYWFGNVELWRKGIKDI